MFKKISKILVPLTMLVGIGFSTTTFTSCSVLSNTKGIVFKQLGSDNQLANEDNAGKAIDSFSNSKSSLEKLYYGTKSINHGNYVMIVGSDTKALESQDSNDGQGYNSALYRLLCCGNDNSISPNWGDSWNIGSKTYSPLINIKNTENNSGKDQHYWEKKPVTNTATGKTTNYINSVNFFSFVDIAPRQFYGNHENTGLAQYYNFSPFYKWQEYDHINDEFAKYSSPDYMDWLYSHDTRDYARNDVSAVNYRKTIARMHLLMPDLIDEDQQDLKVIAWVNGVPSSKTLTTFTGSAQSLTDWLDSVYDEVELK